MPVTLSQNSYGKSAVRLTKVVRRGAVHELFEIDAAVQLEGNFTAAYTAGDNRNVVATDTIKNTVYVLAKENDFASLEDFAVLLARHFVTLYPQVSAARVELTQAAWQRIAVDGRPHDHAFTSAGPHHRTALATLDRRHAEPDLRGGVTGLAVIKTTASEWRDFHADRYRTLRDTSDRILGTTIDATWTYRQPAGDFNACYDRINEAMLTAFATRHSLGAQQTIMHLGEAALSACEAITEIHLALPNQHRIPFNLDPFGLKFENDIFVATDEPYGLIHGTITRGG